MSDVQVVCVNKPHRQSAHEHIMHLGGRGWRLTREEVIRRIDAKIDTFFTLDPGSGKRAEVGVRRELGKAPYVQTYADGIWNNNLLSLAECPIG